LALNVDFLGASSKLSSPNVTTLRFVSILDFAFVLVSSLLKITDINTRVKIKTKKKQLYKV
jgi:hypothetical protein